MKFKSNKKEILDKMKITKEQALEAIGQTVENTAKQLVPVDTGILRASISHEQKDTSVTIGSNVDYAVYIEKGTRHQAAKPYIEPAVNNNRGQIKGIVEKYYRGLS